MKKLYGTVRKYLSIDFDMNILKQINETYIEARYPSELGLLPDGVLSQEKAKLFYLESKKMFSQIQSAINK